MRKVKSCLSVLSALLVTAGLTTTVYGAWQATGSVTNYVNTAKYGTTIVNKYSSPSSVQPNVYIKDTVDVKNVGKTPTLIRVSLEKNYENENLDSSNIILDLDTEHWFDGKDGYYYYKGVLQGNEITEYPILKGFTLDEDDDAYKKKKANIVAEAESIQYYGDFLEEVWGVSYKDLGINKPSDEYTIEKSTIVFNGEKFEYKGEENGDLFLDFKQMVSGSVRTQPIVVENNSNKVVGIKLASMFSEETAQDVVDLINKHTKLTIKDSSGNVLYDGYVGGKKDANIDLGKFNPNESKEFIVTASVSRDIGLDFSNLKGSVVWQFTADDLTPTTIAKTSDTYLLYIGISILVVGMTGLCLSRKRKEV